MVKRKGNTATCTSSETSMHPTIAYKVNRARTAELRSQAQRDHLARGARRGRRGLWRQLTDHLPDAPVMAARRLLIPGVSLAGESRKCALSRPVE
jgi:hypothetical protein